MNAWTKLWRGVSERRGLVARLIASDLRPGGLWFHIASSGELEQCLPILEEVKARNPQESILLTYFSPTAKTALQLESARRKKAGRELPWDYSDYAPFDVKRSVRAFLEVARPRAAVFIHREIWPALVKECEAASVPCYLFAAAFPKLSSMRWKAYGKSLKRFKFVGTVDQTSRENLRERLTEVPVETVGDPRVERVFARKKLVPYSSWRASLADKPTVIFASLWPEDFHAVKDSLSYFLTQKAWRLILVPHEPREGFVQQMESWLTEQKVTVQRWSRWREAPGESRVILVDGVGFLAELYEVATLVFVGGSFKKRVHNVLEPAAYGKPVLTGPYIQNSVEAMEMSRGDYGLFPCERAETLRDRFRGLVEDANLVQSYSKRLTDYLQSRLGASIRYVDLLFSP